MWFLRVVRANSTTPTPPVKFRAIWFSYRKSWVNYKLCSWDAENSHRLAQPSPRRGTTIFGELALDPQPTPIPLSLRITEFGVLNRCRKRMRQFNPVRTRKRATEGLVARELNSWQPTGPATRCTSSWSGAQQRAGRKACARERSATLRICTAAMARDMKRTCSNGAPGGRRARASARIRDDPRSEGPVCVCPAEDAVLSKKEAR